MAAHSSVIELMIQRARPYIFTTAAPPALAHAALLQPALLQPALLQPRLPSSSLTS